LSRILGRGLLLLISRDLLASDIILTRSSRNRRVRNRRTNDLMMGLIRRLLLYRTHELRLCHSGWDILTEICHVRVDEISASTVEMAHSRGRKKLAAP